MAALDDEIIASIWISIRVPQRGKSYQGTPVDDSDIQRQREIISIEYLNLNPGYISQDLPVDRIPVDDLPRPPDTPKEEILLDYEAYQEEIAKEASDPREQENLRQAFRESMLMPKQKVPIDYRHQAPGFDPISPNATSKKIPDTDSDSDLEQDFAVKLSLQKFHVDIDEQPSAPRLQDKVLGALPKNQIVEATPFLASQEMLPLPVPEETKPEATYEFPQYITREGILSMLTDMLDEKTIDDIRRIISTAPIEDTSYLKQRRIMFWFNDLKSQDGTTNLITLIVNQDLDSIKDLLQYHYGQIKAL